MADPLYSVCRHKWRASLPSSTEGEHEACVPPGTDARRGSTADRRQKIAFAVNRDGCISIRHRILVPVTSFPPRPSLSKNTRVHGPTLSNTGLAEDGEGRETTVFSAAPTVPVLSLKEMPCYFFFTTSFA
jgi:hypothetical protein